MQLLKEGVLIIVAQCSTNQASWVENVRRFAGLDVHQQRCGIIHEVNSFTLVFPPFKFPCGESDPWVGFAKPGISKDYVIALEISCPEELPANSFLGSLTVLAAQVEVVGSVKYQSIVVNKGSNWPLHVEGRRGPKVFRCLLADEVDFRAGVVEGSESSRVAVGFSYVDINSDAEVLPLGLWP